MLVYTTSSSARTAIITRELYCYIKGDAPINKKYFDKITIIFRCSVFLILQDYFQNKVSVT